MYRTVSEPVPIRIRVEKPRRGGEVSYIQRHLAIGEYGEDRRVLGLCVPGCTDYVGHMAYELSDDLVEKMATHGDWWFDAGGSMPAQVAEQADLLQALLALGSSLKGSGDVRVSG